MVSLLAPVNPEYLSDLRLSCTVSLPAKLFYLLLPHTTVTWSTPISEKSQTTTETVRDDRSSILLNLTIPSVKETHSGVYTCGVVINLPNNSLVISKEVNYTLNLKG